MPKAVELTPALEDYLEAIFNLCRFNSAARSRDIAELLNVHKSTVTAALKSLGQMKLINYAPYEAVTLTPEGKRLAEGVAIRHSALRDFFVNVLKVDRSVAESAACGMEHSVPLEIVEKLATFAISMRDCPLLEKGGHGKTTSHCDACVTESETVVPLPTVAHSTLAVVEPGRKVTVVAVDGRGAIKKRLTEMGITRGVKLTVKRIAPLGDPIEIEIRGYHLSLRKSEAERVLIKE